MLQLQTAKQKSRSILAVFMEVQEYVCTLQTLTDK